MVIKFDKEIADFLEHHGISESDVLDASGMPTWEYKEMLSSYGYKVAIGVTPCYAYGHTLRSSKGKCVMCDPATLAFRARYPLSGYVYIAQSTESKLIKIGMTKGSARKRVRILNTSGYGGIDDWVLIESKYCNQTGVSENQIKNYFSFYLYPIEFVRRGGWKSETSSEIFNCNLEDVLNYLRQLNEPD